MIDLNGQVVIVTGGAGLTGQSFVRCIVKNKGIAIIADIDKERGEELKRSLGQEGFSEKAAFVELDITNKDSIQSVIERVTKEYGSVGTVINNAYPRNQNYCRSFFEVEYEDFCENVSLHLGGYFLDAQQMASYFEKQQHGNIINIASIYGAIAPRFEIYSGTKMTTPVEYAAIKSAIIHLTKYMAKYLRGKNIRVNAISPGGILDQQPQSFLDAYQDFCCSKGMLDASDLQGVLLFLISPMSQYVNGQNIIVDDGFTL